MQSALILLARDARADEAWPPVFERAAPAVVQVRIGNFWGSGFLYPTPRYIVTTYQVANQSGPPSVLMRDGSVHSARVVAWSDTDDLAILELLPVADVPALKLERSAVYAGARVAALEYPVKPADREEMRLLLGVAVPRFGTVSVVRAGRLDLDIGAQGEGSAGAPVLSPSGNVVGVVSVSRPAVSRGIVTVVSAEAIASLARRIGAQGEFSPSPPMEEQLSGFGGVFVTPLEQAGFVGAGLEGGLEYQWIAGSANIGAFTSWYAPGASTEFAQRQREFVELHLVAQLRIVKPIFLHIGPSVQFFLQDTKVRKLGAEGEKSENIDTGVRPLLDIGATGQSFLIRGVFDPFELGARLDIGVFFGR